MPKRGENIYKRKDNRWEGRYIVICSDGSKKYVSVYAKSYSEVKEKLLINKQKARQNIAALPECRLTVENLLQEWLTTKRNTVKLSSYLHYENLINNQLLPELGDLLLKNLTAKKLLAFINQKQQCGRLDKRGGLSAKTLTDIISLIKSAVKMAATEYELPQAIAIAKLKAPNCKQKLINPFSNYEVRVICQNILQNPTPQNLAVLLSLNTGLRLGEICALRWEDIDFQTQTVTIQRNVQRTSVAGKSQLLIQTPKTESSRRTIPVPKEIMLLLRKIKRNHQQNYVFGACGKPLEPRTLQYHFAALLKKIGVARRSFHTLRHTFASRYIAAGADPKSLSELLGHAQVNITMQLYVHPTLEQKRNHIETINTLRELCA